MRRVALACSVQRFWCAALVVALTLATLGCGESAARKEDTKRLVNLVSEIADGVSTKQGAAEVFATGAAIPKQKAEQEKFSNKQFFTLKKDIHIDGDTAKMTVHVTDVKGNPQGEAEWTAVRESGRWKLQSFPLP